MQRTWKVTVQYDGTDFFGWQVQPDQVSVQGEIQKVLTQIYSSECQIHGSGRTDAGVHALGQVFSFLEPREVSFSEKGFSKALNSLLPDAIRIVQAEIVESDFHARFKAVGKTYLYVIENSQRKLPFMSRYSWNRRHPMNLDLLQQALTLIEGEHDFSAFTVNNQALKGSAVRTVFKTEFEQYEGLTFLRFTGSGFLYKMIRTLTGQLVETACGLSSLDKIEKLLESGCRDKAAQTAPPQGLFLAEVYYSEGKMKERLLCHPLRNVCEDFF